MFGPLSKKAILIDMDGTIVDSHPVLLETYLDFMKQIGLEGSPKEFQELIGPSMAEIVTILRKRYNIDLSVKELVSRYHQTLENVYTNELKIFDGVMEFLCYVKSKGIKVCLVTSATLELAEKFLEAQNINEFFDCIVTPGEGKGKPAPDIYIQALKEMLCEPGDALAIEDSPNGVQAAVSAGVYTIHIFDQSLPPLLIQHALVGHVKDWQEVMLLSEETHGGI